MKNIHILPVPENVQTEAQSHLDAVLTLLSPYVIPLTAEERHDLPKMGDKTLSFVVKSLDYARHYPALRPSYLDMDEFEADVADAIGLRTIHISAKQLSDNVDDTIMVAGSEAYQAALIFYKAAKAAAEQDIPGAKEIYEDLKNRFPGTKKKNE